MSNRNKACVITGMLIFLVVTGISVYLLKVYNYKRAVSQLAYSDVTVQNIRDGNYIGECNVDFIYAKVSVTVKDGTITQIDLIEHEHEKGASAERIIDDIVKRQTIKVDAVSGAINSSKVIIKAVENALVDK